jgi:hypothetical protein
MPTYSSDRRHLLKILGSIGATCAYPFASDELYGQTAPAEHTHIEPRNPARFFNDADFALISRISDLILPPTDTPGAVAAGVPEYIDYVVGRNTDQQLAVADGLRWIDGEAQRSAGKTFLELIEQQQIAILAPLCEASDAGNVERKGRSVQCFHLLKNLTADAYYTSQTGLIEELKYKGNTPRATYPEC